MKTKTKRITAMILTAFMLCIILLSLCAVVMEATHDCTGEDCDICRILGVIIHTIRAIAYSAVILSAGILTDVLRHNARFTGIPFMRRITPVTEKDRLLN
jgi:hypothetical protein